MVHAVIFRVTHTPDDLQPIIRGLRYQQRWLLHREHRTSYALSNRIAVAKELLDECLVYHREVRRTHVLGIVVQPSRQQRNAQGQKFVGADQTSHGLRVRQGWLPLQLDLCVETAEARVAGRSEEHTSELQSPDHLVCRLLLEKKNKKTTTHTLTVISHTS